MPSDLSGETMNHELLIGTAGIQGAGGPTPDFTLPAGFLFADGGTITFFGANSGTYGALPTDGLHSEAWASGATVNSPQNFAGAIGLVPEPTSFVLLICGGIGAFYLFLRRRTA
jgi:hypothetical protein